MLTPIDPSYGIFGDHLTPAKDPTGTTSRAAAAVVVVVVVAVAAAAAAPATAAQNNLFPQSINLAVAADRLPLERPGRREGASDAHVSPFVAIRLDNTPDTS